MCKCVRECEGGKVLREEMGLVVPESQWKHHGGGGLQWWSRKMSPCASLMIQPFGEVSKDFDQWVLQRI